MKPLVLPARPEEVEAAAAPAPASRAAIKILLVDDKPANLVALESLLAGGRYEIKTATSGAQALRLMLNEEFALVLLDVIMPGMDGFDIARLMRERPQSRLTPVIFITAGSNNETHVNRGYSLGAVDYIYKPIVPEVLRSKVQVFVDLHDKTQSLAASQAALSRELAQHREAQESLRRSEVRYSTMVGEIVDCAIFALDLEGRVQTWSKGAQRITGYPPQEILGGDFSLFYSKSERRRRFPQELLRRAEREGRAEHEGWRDRMDGGRFFGHAVITALHDEAGRTYGFVKVLRDMTESMRAAEADRLKEREALQRQLVATVSHELRTPIAAIKAAAETLRSGALSDQRTGPRFMGIIERHADRLAELVEDLLTLAELDSGKAKPQPQNILLRAYARQFVKEFVPLAARKRVTISVAMREELAIVMDPTHLARTLQNLVDNAVKYNKDGGEVRIEARREGDKQARISVRDTGIGIPHGDLPRIFEQFHRTEVAKAQARRGTGLGLYIIKNLVESNGGQIWVESEIGRGSVFHLLVPLAAQ
ncbi:MAG TPA: ATP-binding protein [Elusimicrobiota bacterium]|nr:ATP-binding protein [Elusimicrobiota bacterium]